jgi:integrase
MGTIRERVGKKGKSYHAQVRRKGFPPETNSFRTKAAAERWVKTVEVKMDDGVYLNQKKSKDTTLLEVLNKYELEVTPFKKSAKKELSILNTLRSENIVIHSLAALRSSDFSLLRDQWLARPVKPLMPSSVVRRLALFSHIYTKCRNDWGYEGLSNPLLFVSKPKVQDARSRIIKSRERAAQEDEEADANPQGRAAVVDEAQYLAASTGSKILGPAIQFAIATAMRRSEITLLEWQNIKFLKTGRGVAYLPNTKNNEAREVPLFPDAVRVLKEQRKLNPDQDVVFKITPDALTRAFTRALERARKKYEKDCVKRKERPNKSFLVGLRFHDLRHEAITQIAPHFEMQELAKITGHKTTAMLMRYYHPKAEDLANKFPDIAKST